MIFFAPLNPEIFRFKAKKINLIHVTKPAKKV